MSKITTFQSEVYKACRTIPKGSVSTYSDVARVIGCRSPRAVGQALKVNPFAPEVPCHRVIASSLRIGGFNGQTSGPDIERKLTLLKTEGVEFDGSGRLQDEKQLFRF
jgi:methylated-DNA-[protein]-cysteine S-methyltransferase